MHRTLQEQATRNFIQRYCRIMDNPEIYFFKIHTFSVGISSILRQGAFRWWGKGDVKQFRDPLRATRIIKFCLPVVCSC